MDFSLWTEYGALNSKPIFRAFEKSVWNEGHTASHNRGGDVAVVWSVLENGRMAKNKEVWKKFQGKNVIVLEVGSIKRNTTWKVGLNGVNRDAYFGPTGNDNSRAKKFKIKLKDWRKDGEHILICCQHEKSRQWLGMPLMANWTTDTINKIREYTDRPIVIRPHPRYKFNIDLTKFKNVRIVHPAKLKDTYDDFDLSFDNAWATVNWSSNPGVQSVLAGIPAFVGPSSLAHDVGNTDFSMIEDPRMPDRAQWLNDYAWTEYTIDEIAEGVPLKRLTNKL